MAMIDIWLLRLGLGLFFSLGALHLVYTALDLIEPRRFVPADRQLLPAMRETHIRLRHDAKDFWQSYMGFHLSHSLGLLFFSSIYVILSFLVPELVFHTGLVLILLWVGFAYATLAWLFWFSIPFVVSMLGNLLFVGAIAVHLT